jgi:hypothetical protein
MIYGIALYCFISYVFVLYVIRGLPLINPIYNNDKFKFWAMAAFIVSPFAVLVFLLFATVACSITIIEYLADRMW